MTEFKESLLNLLRSAACTRAVLGILMYLQIHSGSCAPAARNPPSLATVNQRFLAVMRVEMGRLVARRILWPM